MFIQETCLTSQGTENIQKQLFRSILKDVAFSQFLKFSQGIPVVEIVHIKNKCFSKTLLNFRCLPSNWNF